MRIAIVGAGLAGLACAHELERLGTVPDLFEAGRCVGNRAPTAEWLTPFLHVNPGQDILTWVQDELLLPLEPACSLGRCVLHGPTAVADLSGPLGYGTVRGADDRSWERQLARRLAAPIWFHQAPDVRELRQEYDWVVVATGDQRWTMELSHWQRDFAWTARGALVSGSFTPGEVELFLDTRYAGTGYAQVTPLDGQRAMAAVALPDGSPAEAEACWKRFRTDQGFRWEAEVSPFQITRYACGQVGPVVVGNVLLTGAAGGFQEPLGLGGQCPSLTSGVMAARQIVLRDPWLERFARRWRAYYRQMARLRRTVATWTDAEMDRAVLTVKYSAGLVLRSPWHLPVEALREAWENP